ncbi:Succinate dehydrogenase flavoprotein subunit [Pantoea agglomerans]|uniref:Succinate dehydrogenase flavoprotein subunit n=1 Tax=Enterobacter agglomerans TaxID=549 RepID=A0A379AJY2_ENTAG|nr:Succinate dehydrogenase flavoprotein subunit [Pantoea agglomerans]
MRSPGRWRVFNRWENNTTGEDPVEIRKALQRCMQNNFSVFREGEAMAQGLEELKRDSPAPEVSASG